MSNMSQPSKGTPDTSTLRASTPKPGPRFTARQERRTRILRRINRTAIRLRNFGYVVTLLLSLYTTKLAVDAGDEAKKAINQAKNAVDQILQERTDRRQAVNEAICSIVQAIPPGNDRIDEVRSNLSCGPYKPPSLIPSPKRTPSRTPSAGSTFVPPKRVPSNHPVLPIPQPSNPAPTPSSPKTRVITRPVAQPPGTTTRTVVKTPASPAAPPTTIRRSPILPLPGCSITLFGIQVC